MNSRRIILLSALLSICLPAAAYDIGLVPLHDDPEQINLNWGNNISLHGSREQNEKVRSWLMEIAEVPKGLETLQAIENSGHKLFIFHSGYSVISSGKASAPATFALIDGRGQSVDIYFNFDIPNEGSHRVFNTHRQSIEYTAVQNLYHELAHAMHMMQGTWRYAKSERQAIEEENIFRQQQAAMSETTFAERVFVDGQPICPESPDDINKSWRQDVICL